MSAFDDPELERFRQEVNCAALLELWSPPWRLDKRESTRNALKYRRGTGEILIVNHEGRGWWNPLDPTAKGDVFDLVRYLEPGLNFGRVRKRLRQFIGQTRIDPQAATYLELTPSRDPMHVRRSNNPRLLRSSTQGGCLAQVPPRRHCSAD